MIFLLFFPLSSIVSSILSLFISVLHLDLVCTLSLVLFLFSSLLCIILMFPFTLSLVLFFRSFVFSIVYIFLLYFFLVLIFPYFFYYSCILQLFFPSPFYFYPIDYVYYFLLGISLCALWCFLLYCRGYMLCLIRFFCCWILCSTYVI